MIYDYCPEIMEPIRKRGDEIIGHGRTNAERTGMRKVEVRLMPLHFARKRGFVLRMHQVGRDAPNGQPSQIL